MTKRTNKPLVSVIIPVYNAGRFLPIALETTLSQTYKKLEVICVDDGSTDGSWKILKELKKQDPRVKLFRNKVNYGIGYSANKAISYANGDFIARMDADDVMLPDRIEKQVDFLLKHPEIAAVGGQCAVIDERGLVVGIKKNPTSHDEIYKQMYTSMAIQNPTLMVNTKVVPAEALKHNNAYHPVDDLDVIFRIMQFGKVANIAEPVLQYRVYRNSSTMRNPKITFAKTIAVRRNAVSVYGYKPTKTAKVISLLQSVLLSLLPNTLIYTLYVYARGIKTFSFDLPRQATLLYLPRTKVAKYSS